MHYVYMHHFSQHVYLPKTQEELRSTEHKFAKSGFPGAFVSLDVVHCMWKSCPMKSLFQNRKPMTHI